MSPTCQCSWTVECSPTAGGVGVGGFWLPILEIKVVNVDEENTNTGDRCAI